MNPLIPSVDRPHLLSYLVFASVIFAVPIDAGADVFTWGRDNAGQLGINQTIREVSPVSALQSGALAGKTITAVSTGNTHSLALTSDGTVYAWGNNFSGQLGNNSIQPSAEPIAITGGSLAGKTITAIATGNDSSFALASDGTVHAWGTGSFGQLGQGSLLNYSVPTLVSTGALSGKTVTAIASGDYHMLALTSDGLLVAWGRNASGTIGDGTTTQRNTPVLVDMSGVLSGLTIQTINAGPNHNVVTASNGKVYTWGSNTAGQLGDGSTTQRNSPVAMVSTGVLAGKTVTKAKAAYEHTVVLTQDGLLFACGTNGNGALGIGTFGANQTSPVAVVMSGALFGHTPSQIATSSFSTTVMTTDGRLFSWGQNDKAQLGDGTSVTKEFPVAVNLTGALAGKTFTLLNSSCSSGAQLAVASDGTLVGWGVNGFAQLGTGVVKWKNQPVHPTGAAGNVVGVAAGGDQSFYLTSSGDLYSMGAGSLGQLGTGTSIYNRSTPSLTASTASLGGKKIVKISAGNYHTIASTSDGSVYVWGYNGSGQLGDGTTTTRYSPVSISASGLLQGKTVTEVAAGYAFCLALTSDGKLYSWGENAYGQLGDGTTTARSSPVAVDMTGALAGKTVTSIACGFYHVVACTSDGAVYSWGYNSSGQLGDGTSTHHSTPGLISSTGLLAGKTITRVACGDMVSYAISSDGTAYGWGANSYGQIGDGSVFVRNTPVAMSMSGALSGKSVASISSGAMHTVVLTTDGRLYSIGRNMYGVLGDGTFNNSTVPVAVDTSGVLAGTTATQVACARNGYHTIVAASIPSPEIAIEQPAGTDLQDGNATVAFGAQAVNTTVDKTFTINNTGSTSLTGISLSISGTGAARFSVVTSAPTSIAAGGTGTFTLRYTAPATAGTASASLQVASNDSDENPFDIQLSGISYVPVSITSEPQDISAVTGSNVTFSVTATGSGTLAYQWRKHGANINGATSPSYSLTSITSASYDTYDVVVSNTYSSATSRTATLAQATLPVITQQPLSVEVDEGGTATFTAAATGLGLSYQWLRYYNIEMPGKTSPTLQLTNVTQADSVWYILRVSNAAGAVFTNYVTVTVRSPVSIYAHPVGTTVNPGGYIYLTVTASGFSPQYQWRKNGDPIVGQTSDYLYISSARESDEGTYDVVVSNTLNTVTSNPATVIVNDPVVITSQPTSASVDPNTSVTFAVTATGSGTLSYQWFKNNVSISNARSSSYTINSATAADVGSYKVTVSNLASSLTSSTATLSLRTAPTIQTPPVPQTVASGSNVMLSVTATGSGPLSYQWLRNDSPVMGETASTLSFSSVSSIHAGTYKVVVSNSVGSVTSAGALLQVASGIPLIVTQPAHALAASGSNVTFSVSALGTPPLKYQWRKNGKAISGATTATLTLNAVNASSAAAYSVVVTSVNSAISQDAQLGVIEMSTVTMTAVEGTKASMSVVTAGSGLELVWLRNNVPLNLSSRYSLTNGGHTFTINPLQASDTAGFRCQVNGPGSTTFLAGITSLRVITSAPIIPEGSTMGPFVIGTQVNYQIPTDPAPERTATSYDATGLPLGLKVDKTTGYISGRPTAWRALPYDVKLTAKNARGSSSLNVHVTISPLPDGMAGEYNGLWDRQASINSNLGGTLRITVASNGSYTGTLRQGKQSASLTGYVETDAETGIAQVTTSIILSPSKLLGQIAFAITPGADGLDATFSQGANTLVTTAAHCPWSKSNPLGSTVTGTYNTAYLPEAVAGDLNYPQGAGINIITVNTDGTVSWRGHLADDTAFTGSGVLGTYGELALWTLLYNNLGSFQGLHLIDHDNCNGTASWIKGPSSTRSYKNGFAAHDLTIAGARYAKPAAGSIILGMSPPPPDNASLRFDYGGLSPAALQPLQVSTAHKVTFPSGLVSALHGLTVTVVPTTGEISGSFSLVDADPLDLTAPIGNLTRTPAFKALVIPRSDVGVAVGYFNLAKLPRLAGETLLKTDLLSGKATLSATR